MHTLKGSWDQTPRSSAYFYPIINISQKVTLNIPIKLYTIRQKPVLVIIYELSLVADTYLSFTNCDINFSLKYRIETIHFSVPGCLNQFSAKSPDHYWIQHQQ